MLIAAGEDIGLADPHALTVVESAAAAFDRVGMPEGRFHLTHAALYLATAEKSNSSLGFFDALGAVEREAAAEVPRHLKDANRDKEGLGHGEGYLYPHAYRDHWIAQQYLPAELHGRLFYRPSSQGYEGRIKEQVERHREAQLAAALREETPEILTFSPADSERDRWLARAAESGSGLLQEIRESLFAGLPLARHHRVAVLRADDGILLWEALRRVPEGGVSALLYRESSAEYLRSYAELMEKTEQPDLWTGDAASFARREHERGIRYEAVIGYNAALRSGDRRQLFRSAAELLADGGILALAEVLPREGARLSELPQLQELPEHLRSLLAEGERELYEASPHPLLSFGEEELRNSALEAGLTVRTCSRRDFREERRIRPEDIERWLAAGVDAPTLGDHIYSSNGSVEAEAQRHERLKELERELKSRAADRIVPWRTRVCFFTAELGRGTKE
jgi:putative ATPase